MAGCTVATEDAQPESSVDEAALARLSPAAKMAKLAALLRTKGTVTMPPLGRKEAANELDSHVDLLPPSTRGLNELFRDRMTVDSPMVGPLQAFFNLADRQGPDVLGALATRKDAELEGDDMHAVLAYGHNDAKIRDFLLDDVSSKKKAEARALLSGLNADYARMTIFDIGAEIIAIDVIVIRPDAPDARTLVLQLSYVHA